MTERYIGHKKYVLENKNLICEIQVSNPRMLIDLQSKTKRLYCLKGKAFILETVADMTGKILETKVVSEKDARALMDKHPEGIKESVYKRHLGEPEEV